MDVESSPSPSAASFQSYDPYHVKSMLCLDGRADVIRHLQVHTSHVVYLAGIDSSEVTVINYSNKYGTAIFISISSVTMEKNFVTRI